MSPEQAQGEKGLDARSDLWSLGAIAFECLTGRRPFAGEALGEILMRICYKPIPIPSDVGEVPDGFDAWFARASQREPKDRYQDAQTFATSLAEVLSPGQRWVDTRTEDVGSPTTGTTGKSAVASLGDAPTERPDVLPGAATGHTASRTVTPMEASQAERAGRAGRYAVVVLAAVAVAAVAGVGLMSGGPGETSAPPMPPEAAASKAPEVAPPASLDVTGPSVSRVASGTTARAAPPAASSSAGSAVSAPGSAVPPRVTPSVRPPVGPPVGPPVRPPSSPAPGAPAPTPSVNLGI
jgi:serine/threonine-protein kinase